VEYHCFYYNAQKADGAAIQTISLSWEWPG